MPEESMLLLRQIIDAWLNRDTRKAARAANSLAFWDDGMLGELRKIANGRGTADTVKALQKKFDASNEEVSATMERLRTLRNSIGPNNIGRQIEVVLGNEIYGKEHVRLNIQYLLTRPAPLEQRELAADICRSIETLNHELGRLDRLVKAG